MVAKENLLGTCGNPEEINLKLQNMILYYLQRNPTKPYHPRLIHAAFPFLAIGLSLEDAYRCFSCFLKIFLPKFFTEDKKVLQYPIFVMLIWFFYFYNIQSWSTKATGSLPWPWTMLLHGPTWSVTNFLCPRLGLLSSSTSNVS